MGRINNWAREVWYRSLKDDEVQQAVDENGQAVIAAWRHTEIQMRLEHVYEPNADEPFKVELKDEEVNLEEEGRYETRDAGGDANKDLMRRYPSAEEQN